MYDCACFTVLVDWLKKKYRVVIFNTVIAKMSSSITNQAILLRPHSGLSDRIPESQITAVFYPEPDNWICASLFPVQVQHSVLIQVNTYAETSGFSQLVLQGEKKTKK